VSENEHDYVSWLKSRIVGIQVTKQASVTLCTFSVLLSIVVFVSFMVAEHWFHDDC